MFAHTVQDAIRSAQRASAAAAAAAAVPSYQQALNSSQLFQQQQQQSSQQTSAAQLSQLHQQTMLPASFHQQFHSSDHQVGGVLHGVSLATAPVRPSTSCFRHEYSLP